MSAAEAMKQLRLNWKTGRECELPIRYLQGQSPVFAEGDCKSRCGRMDYARRWKYRNGIRLQSANFHDRGRPQMTAAGLLSLLE